MSRAPQPITAESLAVFLMYANDAQNWTGSPLVGGNVGGTKEQRGNLTQLKRAKLIETFTSDGLTWIRFTAKGGALAKQHGITIENCPLENQS